MDKIAAKREVDRRKEKIGLYLGKITLNRAINVDGCECSAEEVVGSA